MLRRGLLLRLGAALPASLVSLRQAPSFIQPPMEEVVGKPLKAIDLHHLTAYVLPNVISVEEEQALMALVHPWFSRLPFNDGHMDGLIHHYKEFYRSYGEMMGQLRGGCPSTSPSSSSSSEEEEEVPTSMAEVLSAEHKVLAATALERVRGLATTYLPNIPIDDRVHCLRLAGSGFIRSHVDESRNSTGIIGGLCLNAGRVMTLTHPNYPGEKVELLLAPRCFYALIGRARYEWEHSVDWVQDDDEHIQRIQKSLVVEGTNLVFDGQELPLQRHDRTAIIFRGVSPMHLLAHKRAAGRG